MKILFSFFLCSAIFVYWLSHDPIELENSSADTKVQEKIKVKMKATETPPKIVKKEKPLPADLKPMNQPLQMQTFQGFLSQSSQGSAGLRSGRGDSVEGSIDQAQNQNRKAQVLGHPSIEYPSHAKAKGLKGFVVIKGLVDLSGEIGQLSIIKSEPPGVFDQDVMNQVRKWKFLPEIQTGQAIQAWWTQKIRFDYE